MARVALVTGGTRGIGAAITKALKAAGYQVAANYGGNDEAAQKFKAETGIPVFKWDVSSYDACNAGITRDAMFHRMKPDQWTAVINTNLGSLFNMCRPLIEGMRERKFGRIINISSINARRGRWVRRTIPRPRRATWDSPRRWRRNARVWASRSMRSARVTS